MLSLRCMSRFSQCYDKYLFKLLFRYADVQFSKNPEKYVKYRPQDVSAMLNNLFDDRV